VHAAPVKCVSPGGPLEVELQVAEGLLVREAEILGELEAESARWNAIR
jgi:hypothetical protein